MNVNFVKIKFWYLFIELVIETYHAMCNMYECSLYVEPILYHKDIFLIYLS